MATMPTNDVQGRKEDAEGERTGDRETELGRGASAGARPGEFSGTVGAAGCVGLFVLPRQLISH